MKISTESSTQINQDYSDALSWMKKIGVKLSTGRTTHYEKVVRHWTKEYKTASVEQGKAIFKDFVSSIYEVQAFIDIYKAFRDTPIDRLSQIVKKLQKGVNGPIDASYETPKSTSARNFLFEAIVAARFNRPERGVKAILSSTSDTGIIINNKKLWIECKRVTTSGKIESNVKKASTQLEKIIRKQYGSGHRGIVALDITKILDPGDQIFVSNNDSELISSIEERMDSFINEYSEIWENLYNRRDKKIIGTFIHFSFSATSESRSLLVNASQWGMNTRIGISDSDQNVLHILAKLVT